MTKVKICGITSVEDALYAVECGADMIGFNFVKSSPRYISPESAKHIVDHLPKGVGSVAVLVDESIDRATEILVGSRVDTAQFHGDESAEELRHIRERLGVSVIKAFRMSADFREEVLNEYRDTAILLDAYSPTEHGGTGQLADWNAAKAITAGRIDVYLAGGLTPENVLDAIHVVRPYAVDVASGVESSPGKKDRRKIKDFIKHAKNT